jgi:hypothetical protein|tara:strand:+ start:3269 stop:3685 length:417 start_codon:yes stop_codon:yes gene_type:complete
MASCTKCERKPTNTGCPVYNMNDGRHFTSYVSRCVLNNSSTTSNVMNSYEHRMYLQHNAEKIMKENQNTSSNNNECVPCYDKNEDGTMVPELNKFQCNANTCNLNNNKSNGIGTGRNYKVPINKNETKVVPKENFMSF